MEETWKWAVGGMLLIFLGMRYAKGCWVKAMMSGFIAPLLIVPMFFSLLIGVTTISKYLFRVFSSGRVSDQMISDFGLAGAVAITIGLFVGYCIWERQTIGIEIRGVLGSGSSNDQLTSPHALKRKFG